MLMEIVLSMVVLSPTGLPVETPEISYTPVCENSAIQSDTEADTEADTAAVGQGLTLIDGFRDSREAQYYDDTYYYHDYVVTEVEWNKNPIAPCGYWTVWGIDDYGTIECLGDDIAEDELEDWMVTDTKVRHRWMPTEEWYHSIDFEIIG